MKATKQNNRITWRKVRGHLKTINEHKLLVMKHCFRIGLYRQGLMHDLSKYMPSELLMGFRYYDDGKSSPNNGERRDKGYSNAWMHHKGRNKHHFEYWTDYALNPSERRNPLQSVQMPRRYVAEMLMDRICASKNYNKDDYTQHDPLQYFEKGRGHYLLHPQTEKELHGMLRILDQCGEEKLFYFVREYYLKGYKI
jgi:hypothetical protein